MRGRLVGFIERMTTREFLLVVLQFLDLFWGEDGEFLLFDVGYFFGLHGGKVAVVGEFWEGFLPAETPG